MKTVLPVLMTFNREWDALLISIFIINVLFYFSEFWWKQYYLFLWILTGTRGSRCQDSSHGLGSGIYQVKHNNFLDQCPYGGTLIEPMLQGWSSQPSLEKDLFFIFLTIFWQRSRKDELHNYLPYLNFGKRAIFLTLLISKSTFLCFYFFESEIS